MRGFAGIFSILPLCFPALMSPRFLLLSPAAFRALTVWREAWAAPGEALFATIRFRGS
ncbi:hypothetical protein SLEP1_g47379 [Rubroshorea leprosula]|uniref:Uncharacterized protein n=1 Tax=Rubroshorea leprosula TaxID=152421 RepID=A0AAV5LQC4_9ROSI|nr:hypothetical protein SLEP1_g47379 [Rubroshorea leprosula]